MKAVVFVDVQKDFIDGALRNEKAIEVTPKIVEFAKDCVKNGYKLYATRDTHEKTTYIENDYTHALQKHLNEQERGNERPCLKDGKMIDHGYLATLEGQKLPVEHCIEGTDGWMIDDRLMEVLEGKTTFVNKPTFGSFDLAEIINEDFFETAHKDTYTGAIAAFKPTNGSLDEIVICGFVSSICVAANAILLRAKFPNVKITVMKDLCAGIADDDHNAAMKVLEMQQIDVK